MSIPGSDHLAPAGGSTGLTDPVVGSGRSPAVGARRTTVLDCLRRSAAPTTAAAVAEQTGLHLNTARFHLDGLVAQGYAERRSEERGTPGRPRILYAARSGTAATRSYRLLSSMLVGLVRALDDGGSAAVDAGRAWGRDLVEAAAPLERVDGAEALARLNVLMDHVGFEPETRSDDSDGVAEVHLHHCPFLEVAEVSTDVVCSLHLGLMQGALDELRAPLEVESLQPFATPHACVARLRSAPRQGTTEQTPARPPR